MPARSLQDLYLEKLKMMYDAEQQGVSAMSQMAELVNNEELRQGIEAHRRQTEEQVHRLEQIFEREGQQVGGRDASAIRALVGETQQVAGEITDPDTCDAFLIGALQTIEHHEIADYGTARTWAQQLGRSDDAELLEQTLQEEKSTDQLLTDIAERMVNREAAHTDRDVTPRAQRDEVTGGVSGGATGGAGRGTQAQRDPDVRASDR